MSDHSMDMHSAGHGFVVDEQWSPPKDRAEASTMVNALSHDVTIILAQLAESSEDWCARTGRTEQDHARWRRRALFAKAHKENQLRECKRLRQEFATEDRSHDPKEEASALELGQLELLCRRVVTEWDQSAAVNVPRRLDGALAALAAYLRGTEHSQHAPDDWELQGVRSTSYAARAQAGA